MRLKAIWSTASVRLTLLFIAIFGIGGTALVASIDYGLFHLAEEEVRADLSHQMDIMRHDAARLGSHGLVAMLESQDRNRAARRYLFLVETRDGRSFSNGLKADVAAGEGFHRSLATKGRPIRWPDQRPNMMILSHSTADGTLLAIGRDTQHLDELRHGIRIFALWGGFGVMILAFLAGLVVAIQFLRRLDGVNRAVERIMSGDPSRRLPIIGFGREFTGLTQNLNRMLDRQEATMGTLKSVSEGIAHELRTPLSRLRIQLEELDARDPDRQRQGIDLAIHEIGQITELFDALLALSHLEHDDDARSLPRIDPSDIVSFLADTYRPVVEDAGGILQISGIDGAAPMFVHGDPGLLTQALSNLLENAIIHAVDAPVITIEAERVDDHVMLTVADRGPGIPPAEREKVVKRFYRMDSSRSRPGSGLGLAMCAAVAKRHGGALLLTDNAPGLRARLVLPGA